MNSPFEIELDGFEQPADETRPLDNDLQVVTPENIAFQYRVAGPFRRIAAYLTDLFFIIVGYGIGIGILYVIFAVAVAILGEASGLTTLSDIIGGIAGLLYQIGLLLVVFFYSAIMETYWNGQSFGKMIFGLRVLSVDGRAINGGQAVLRNLVRLADIFPMFPLTTILMLQVDPEMVPLPFFFILVPLPTAMVGVAVMMMNRNFQRLGDLFCRTIVVVDQKTWHGGLVDLNDVRVKQLAGHIPNSFVISKELAQALASYVDRRSQLTLPRLMEISKHLGEPLLHHFQFDPSVNHDLLLCALYYHSFNDAQEDDQYTPPGISPVMKARNPTNPYDINYIH